MTDEEVKEPLGEDPTLSELFDQLLLPESGVNVRPLSLQQDEDDTRLLICIRGHHGTASFIMAEVMSKIQELFDLQEQQEASDAPRIARV